MSANILDNTDLGRGSNWPVRSVFHWLRQAINARQARRSHARELQALRDLDQAILEDVGISYDRMADFGASLAACNPHAIAIGVITRSRSGQRG